MNKKYLIILAAACLACLGIGIVIGGGLSQNSLSATAANKIDEIQNTLDAYLNGDNDVDPEFLNTALSGMEAELSGYAQRVKDLNDRKKEARTTLTGIRDMIEEGSLVMSNEIYSDLHDIIEVGSDEILEAITRDLRELDVMRTCKPGDTLSREEWDAIAAKVEDVLNGLGDVADLAQYDLQKANQDYTQAVQTIAAIMKEQHDDINKTISDLK